MMRAAGHREDLGGLVEPDPDALGTPAQTEMACRRAGVELRVTGAESFEATGLSARVRKGGEMAPELAEAIRHHRVGIIARLLAREPAIGGVPSTLAAGLREGRDGGSTLGNLWPAECLESQAKFGHRCGRLYPLLQSGVLIGDEEGGVVGTLLQAMAGEAMVFVSSDTAIHPFGDPEKPAFVPARFVQAADVWPTDPGAAPKPRGSRMRPHDGEADLRMLPAPSPVREEERP